MEEVGRNECLRKDLVPNKINIYNERVQRIKKNTHIVLAMSPLSPEFSSRLRMFPAFINCCTLDFFTEWPDEALLGVGRGALEEYVIEFGLEQNLDKVVDMFRTDAQVSGKDLREVPSRAQETQLRPLPPVTWSY